MRSSVWRRVLSLAAAVLLTAAAAGIPAEAKQSGQSQYGQIAVGDWGTAFLRPNGTVVVSDDSANQATAKWKDISQIAANSYGFFGVTKRGGVVATDSDMANKLGGWKNIKALAISQSNSFVNEEFILGLKEDGTVMAYVPEGYSLNKIASWKNVTAVAAGEAHAVGLLSDGTVAAAGSNEYGQCDVSGWRNVTAVAAGSNITVGLKKDGKVLIAGNLSQGEKNRISAWKNMKAIAVGYGSYVVGLREDGRTEWSKLVRCNSVAFEGPEGLPANWTDVEAVFGDQSGFGAFRGDGSMLLIGSWLTSAAVSCRLTDNTEQHTYYCSKDWPLDRTLTCTYCGNTVTVPKNTGYGRTIGCEHYWVEYPDSAEEYDGYIPCVEEITYFCVHCGSLWDYETAELTEMDVVRDSNDKKKSDIIEDDWQMLGGSVYEDSLRFWVVNKRGYDNTEFIEYDLDGDYALLQCWVGIEKSSDPKTDISFTIYGDGVELMTIQTREDTPVSRDISVEGVQTLRISCTNRSSANGYGVFGGQLFEPMDFS